MSPDCKFLQLSNFSKVARSSINITHKGDFNFKAPKTSISKSVLHQRRFCNSHKKKFKASDELLGVKLHAI
jgi:hypothetical protein